MIKKRSGLIVNMHHIKSARYLKKFGTVYYISKRLKYAVLYCDEADYQETRQRLQKQGFVKNVLPSYLGYLSLEGEQK